MPYCGECGKETKRHDRFCESCGHELEPSDDQATPVNQANYTNHKGQTTGAGSGGTPSGTGGFGGMKKFLVAGLAAAVVIGGYVAFGTGDGSGNSPGKLQIPAGPATGPKKVASSPVAVQPVVKLESYSGGFFTMEKPANWQITLAGQGTTLGMWSRDPQEPARQIFFFGAVGPFYLSHQQKSIDQQYMNSGGYPVPWVDMPVVSPPTASNFLSKWNALTNSRIAKGYMAALPVFPELTIISAQPVPSQYRGQTELVRALFKMNGQVIEGLFTTTVMETVPFANGPGGHQAYAVMFMGVTAPQREFIHVQEGLIASLASFNLSDEYVRKYIETSRENFKDVMRAGQTLRETSDIITKGWRERQKTYDILSAKRSDAMLSKERLKDPRTGDVYEFPNGWYETNRDKTSRPNLQPLADNDYDGWTAPTKPGFE